MEFYLEEWKFFSRNFQISRWCRQKMGKLFRDPTLDLPSYTCKNLVFVFSSDKEGDLCYHKVALHFTKPKSALKTRLYFSHKSTLYLKAKEWRNWKKPKLVSCRRNINSFFAPRTQRGTSYLSVAPKLHLPKWELKQAALRNRDFFP